MWAGDKKNTNLIAFDWTFSDDNDPGVKLQEEYTDKEFFHFFWEKDAEKDTNPCIDRAIKNIISKLWTAWPNNT